MIHIRASTRGRSAQGLINAEMALTEYNYTQRFAKAKRGVKANGLRFENKIVNTLEAQFGNSFISGIPFRFSTVYSAFNVCIPDGLLISGDRIIILEMKLRHTADAWWQLKKLYKPVVEKALNKNTRLLEICKYYEPEVRVPESQPVFNSIDQFLYSKVDFGCVIWGR